MDFFLLAFVFALAAMPLRTQAVPPPDFIISLGTTLTQFFTLFFLFAAASASAGYRFLQMRLKTQTSRLTAIATLIVLTVGISIGGTLIYRSFAEQQARQQIQALQTKFLEDQKMPVPATTPEEAARASSSDVQPAPEDAMSVFIRSYYFNIASGNLREAYEQSKKTVSYATFAGWYAHTDAISIDRLQRIDETRSSLELTLLEQGATTRYAVLMDVGPNASGTLQVLRSDSREISLSPLPATGTIPLAVSNADFKKVSEENGLPILVLDAREDVENEYGRYPGSLHIRFADLKAGRWVELPVDRPIFVLCWSAIRGKEVTEFLRAKNIRAQYLENGASGWVDFGGRWEGSINFLDQYTEDRYRLLFTKDQVRDAQRAGTMLVDTRAPASFEAAHIPGSLNIPLMSTPSVSVESVMAQVPAGASVITVCDGYVNCFDAKLVGVELERRGHAFLGRFATPRELY